MDIGIAPWPTILGDPEGREAPAMIEILLAMRAANGNRPPARGPAETPFAGGRSGRGRAKTPVWTLAGVGGLWCFSESSR